jgi:hypothetical protein
MASTSLAGTFNSMFGLRMINGVGIGLFIFWSLAPIGSQAGLRTITNNGTLSKRDRLSYMSTNATPVALEAGNKDLPYYKYAVDSLFATSVLTPSAMTSPQDVWANVKIPSLEWLERHNGCGADGWCSLAIARDNNASTAVDAGTYSSLTGMPVVGGIYGLGVQNFSLESSYFSFQCSAPQEISTSVILTSTLTESQFLQH